jgi:hypothetical protein
VPCKLLVASLFWRFGEFSLVWKTCLEAVLIDVMLMVLFVLRSKSQKFFNLVLVPTFRLVSATVIFMLEMPRNLQLIDFLFARTLDSSIGYDSEVLISKPSS